MMRYFYCNVELPLNPQGTHTPYKLKQILEQGNESFTNALNHFGEESGLWKNVSISSYSGMPFEITIQRSDEHFKTTNVGYGVSQVLPILVEVLQQPNHRNVSKNTLRDFLIQREVRLNFA